MKTLFIVIANLMLLCIAIPSQSQNTDWLAIPMNQTNLYADSNTGSSNNETLLIPMQTDMVDVTYTYGVYNARLTDAFDTCADEIWNYQMVYGRPLCDIYQFQKLGSELTVSTYHHLYTFPLGGAVNELHDFRGDGDYLIKRVFDTLTTVFNMLDSVKSFEVYGPDSLTFWGSIKVSKMFGLLDYTPFRVFDFGINSGKYWHLVGIENDGLNVHVGQALPSKEEFIPYEIGDELLFEHVYYENVSNDFVVRKEWHAIIIEEVGIEPEAYVQGECEKYDDQGFYIGSESNYRIDFDPWLDETTLSAFSVPYLTDHEYEMPAITKTQFQTDSGFVKVNNAMSVVYCDTNQVADGAVNEMIHSTEYGLLYIIYGGIRPPTSWRLIAADFGDKTYGTWPTWLGEEKTPFLSSLRVYPNPSQGDFYVDGLEGKTSVWVTDASGALLIKTQLNAQSNHFQLNSLDKGVYFFHTSSSKPISLIIID